MKTTTGLRMSGTMALFVLLLTAGCGGGGEGGGGGSGSTTASSASAYDALFTDPTNTVNVTPTRDPARATTQLVTAASGGTLTATDANGNQFSLSIPAGALSMDTTITMTPLASMAGLPFSGGLVAGVQFEPQGLNFDQPATLTIVPASPVPVMNQTFFGYSGAGNDLYLAPPANKTSALTLVVQHFSGGGVANGTSAERGAMVLKRAADAEARLTQIVAAELSAERQLQIAGTSDGSNPLPSLDGYYSSYYNLVVTPLVGAAGTSCKNAYVGLQKYLFLNRQYQLLFGASMPFDSTGVALNTLRNGIIAKCNGLPYRFRGTFTTTYQNGPTASGTVTFARDDYACSAAAVTFAFGSTACFTVESVSYTSTAAYTDLAGCTHSASGNVALSNTSALDSNLQISTTANAGMHDYAVVGWWHKVFPKAETVTCPGPFVYTTDYYADAALASTQQGQAYPTTDGVTAAGSFTSGNTYLWSLKAAQ